MNTKLTSALSGIAVLCSGAVLADGWQPIAPPGTTPYATQAGLKDSIANTRHNLTQSFSKLSLVMTVAARNNYGEICVYCHTPHGANTNIKAPIWNRTVNNPGNYKIYDKLRTLNRPIGQPGANSLTCLSCHDGTIAIDSIINMPGSGRYSSKQNNNDGVVDKDWLSTWPNRDPIVGAMPPPLVHAELGNEYPADASQPPPADQAGKCAGCHQLQGAGSPPDFRVFVIGTDLRNDHPIGILFPDQFGPGTGVDFNEPTGVVLGKLKFFDRNRNGHADTNEPRLYDTGDGPEVECASCHDPHGIPTNGPGSEFIPSFLRVSNGNVNTGNGNSSGLCLTCHLK